MAKKTPEEIAALQQAAAQKKEAARLAAEQKATADKAQADRIAAEQKAAADKAEADRIAEKKATAEQNQNATAALVIKSKSASFCRAGHRFSTEPCTILLSELSDDQIELIKAEPELIVEEVA